MMDILMSEICWAYKKRNKIASDIKLVFHSSTITMTHGPINIRYKINSNVWRRKTILSSYPTELKIMHKRLSFGARVTTWEQVNILSLNLISTRLTKVLDTLQLRLKHDNKTEHFKWINTCVSEPKLKATLISLSHLKICQLKVVVNKNAFYFNTLFVKSRFRDIRR